MQAAIWDDLLRGSKRAEVADFIVSKFEELAGVDLAGVLPSDEIVAHLHLDEPDSLATVEILTEIEAKFGITVTDKEAVRTRTSGGLRRPKPRRTRSSAIAP